MELGNTDSTKHVVIIPKHTIVYSRNCAFVLQDTRITTTVIK